MITKFDVIFGRFMPFWFTINKTKISEMTSFRSKQTFFFLKKSNSFYFNTNFIRIDTG